MRDKDKTLDTLTREERGLDRGWVGSSTFSRTRGYPLSRTAV